MSQQQAAQRYAAALYEVVNAEEREQVHEEFQQVMDVLADPDIAEFFFHPRTPIEERQKAIAAMQLQESLYRFLMLVLTKGREQHLAAIAEAFRTLIYEDAGIRTAKVSSAIPLSDSTVDDIRERLTKLTGDRTIELEVVVDADIWGGLVIEMDGKIIDGSLATQMERFRQSLSSQP